LAAGAEEWLLANRNHPEAKQVQEKLDRHLSIWLRGHLQSGEMSGQRDLDTRG